ncbi:MAG: DUF4876 domain-containing protein [Rikenellaceae bacterium]
MKRITTYITILLLLTACALDNATTPHSSESLNTLTVKVVYPSDYSDYSPDGMTLSISNIDFGYSYTSEIDAAGESAIELPDGRYIVQFSGRHDNEIFNATADNIMLTNKNITLELSAIHSIAGSIIFKEIYCGGCMKTPEEGTYQYDKYIIVHNNSSTVEYLDKLCFGILDPYNSNATNIWVSTDPDSGATIFADELYLIQAIWQFGGDGTTFPLQPGEDAVICQNGAIDHAALYPLSVNLNKEGYFVLYNSIYFTSTTYHPAPGDNISVDRYLDVAIKLGQANAWPLSTTSPAPVLFRVDENTTIEEYLMGDGVVFSKPGSTSDNVAKIPLDWVLDGVEVFNGSSSSNTKRFSSDIDAGYVTQTATYDGKSLHRQVDEESSATLGYEVLIDTNNSTTDFYERSEASLHE